MDYDTDIIFRIAAMGIAVAVISQILTKAGKDEQALMVTIAGIIIVSFMIIRMSADLFSAIRTLFMF